MQKRRLSLLAGSLLGLSMALLCGGACQVSVVVPIGEFVAGKSGAERVSTPSPNDAGRPKEAMPETAPPDALHLPDALPLPDTSQPPGPQTCQGKAPLAARLWRLSPQQIKLSVEDVFGIKSSQRPALASYDRSSPNHPLPPNIASLQQMSEADVAALFAYTGAVSLQILAEAKPWKDCFDAADNTCLQPLLAGYGRRLWRRTLTQEEQRTILASFDTLEMSTSRQNAFQYLIERLLMSPSFLFRSEEGVAIPGQPGLRTLTSQEVATWLSFTLWSSVPDETLLQLAAQDKLQSEAAVLAQIDRMLLDPKATRGLLQLFDDWLQLSQILSVQKQQPNPAFDDSLRQDLYTSAHQTLTHLISKQKLSLTGVFTSQALFANGKLAKVYTDLQVSGSGFQLIAMDTNKRMGPLSWPVVQALHSASGAQAIHRGVYLAQKVLCDDLTPANNAVDLKTLIGELDVTALSEREVIETLITNKNTCKGCHVLFDPLGFGLGMYDAIGRHRTSDNMGKPTETSGKIYQFVASGGADFQDGFEMLKKLVSSERFARCFAKQTATFVAGESLTANQSCMVAHTYEHLKKASFQVDKALKAALIHPRFLQRALVSLP